MEKKRSQICRLCESLKIQTHHETPQGALFWLCQDCGYVFRDQTQLLTLKEEQARYDSHENDVESEGYQKFLRPVVNCILQHQTTQDHGLDYGCGPSSVIEYLLKQQNYLMDVYDPYFYPENLKPWKTYDYVSCTEVVEHFHQPLIDFAKILQIMKPRARLYIKTGWLVEVAQFPQWHYHRDPTHVGFFNEKSFGFLAQKFGLQLQQMRSECVILVK